MATENLSKRMTDSAGDTELDRFTEALLEHQDEADLKRFNADELLRQAQIFWAYGDVRKPGSIKLRTRIEESISRTRHYGVLEIIADDRPFIVASVLAELGRLGLQIAWIGHPIVAVERDAAGGRKRLVATRQEVRALAEKIPGVVRESMILIALENLPDEEERAAIESRMTTVLSDVALVVDDWQPMLVRLDEAIADLRRVAGAQSDPEEFEESAAFLQWLKDNHFIFMGVRDYDQMENGTGVVLQPDAGSSVGILKNPGTRILRRDAGNEQITPPVAAFLESPSPIIVTKANFRSNVHRPVYMDYVGVKRFGADGRVIGERRFLGLFTSGAYNQLPESIPMLRRKVAIAHEKAGFRPGSHNDNIITNIIETYPRDELFQLTPEELYRFSTGIMRLYERPRTRLFVRRDKFDRFVSALVFVPRERYSTDLRERMGDLLKDAFNGRVSAFYPQLGDNLLVRVHYIIGRNPGPCPDIATEEIEQRLVLAARSWRDLLSEELTKRHGEESADQLMARYGEAFPVSYQSAFSPEAACEDIAHVERLADAEDSEILVYHNADDDVATLRIKLFKRVRPITLSKSLPVFEHMGLAVVSEYSYELAPIVHGAPALCVHIHDFELRHPADKPLAFEDLRPLIEAAYLAIWRGQAEDDGFNRLIVEAALPWQEVVIFRALARYLLQTGASLSQRYMQDTLAGNPDITHLLLDLFRTRFDPDRALAQEDREKECIRLTEQILARLEDVQSIDQDKILRQFINLITAALRTNYYQSAEGQTPRATLAVKFNSKSVEGLPEPVPHVEIFVYSPRFEGVHLRFGPVARGGLRWSDRREDFRTEVLGLVKAQYVKNAVIVPVGAKGGFVPKHLPAEGTREQVQAEGIACYKAFIGALLDLTDNLNPNDPAAEPIKPLRTVAHDAPDPYLVVAADKGTATFSDIANQIALDRGFWLGDAFASGGSNGYDHKAMGITARGAWEAVKRHFREVGRDIQSTPFTAIGVGDMSGDVFGNGMLLSGQTRLVAAFDHRDIFLDPNPDPEASYNERLRLFNEPRSSWQDYDKSLISRGGGVFSRKSKSIPLSPEMQALLGVELQALSPFDLIQTLLKAEVDLLWFGGIGTYIKARAERNAEVGDLSNDSIRVDGEDVRALVIGEGANLGCTQKGRIAYALSGGRINTDAIDNAAGVDCSDHEVNIKILLDAAVAQGAMEGAPRNALLKEMTASVAEHVLQHNYDQSLAVSLAQATAREDLDAHGRFMKALEREGRLKRDVEGLPNEEELQDRKAAGQGLTRPEIAVLLAYSKIRIFDELVASSVPDDAALESDLVDYFPKVLADRFAAQVATHRLRREIIATCLANELVHVGGLTFISRMRELSGAETPAIVRAYVAAREVFETREISAAINALDNKIPADRQAAMHVTLRAFVRRQSLWFLRRDGEARGDIAGLLATYKKPVAYIRQNLKQLSSPYVWEKYEEVAAGYLAEGVPQATAAQLASLRPLLSVGNVVDAALECDVPIDIAARAHSAVGEMLGLERLSEAAFHLTSNDHWERLALRRIVEDLAQQQAALAAVALRNAAAAQAGGVAAVEVWAEAHAGAVRRVQHAIEELESAGAMTTAHLSLAVGHIRDLVMLAAQA